MSDCAYPQKTMEFLYRLKENYDCMFIRGNREEYMLAYAKSSEKNWKPCSASGSLFYTYENLTKRDLDFFASMENHGTASYPGCPKLTVCHGSIGAARNPGSVGEPWYYGGRAQFALLHCDGSNWTPELLRVSYDVEQVVREFAESGLNDMAPSWARMSRETIRTGVDKSTPVLNRVTEICADTYMWPDYPEELWEQAIREVWPEMQEE